MRRLIDHGARQLGAPVDTVSIVSGTSRELIGGRYRLVELIGQGGMGRVWRGWDETLRRDVALKEVIIPTGLTDDQRETLVGRVMREARAAARLNHPGIITVHDAVEHNGAPVIVMELIAGRSLATEIRKHGRLPVRRVAEIGESVLDALNTAHTAGVVHRDVKPDNILLSGRRVILTDFGIAGVTDATMALTSTGMIVGTPTFLAPEQLDNKPATAASDLWSLGVTLYAAVEGEPPFSGDTLTALCVAILTREPRQALQAGALAPVLAGLLRKDPGQRATAENTARALAALCHTTPADPAAVDEPPPPLEPAVLPTATDAPPPVAPDIPTRTRTGFPAGRVNPADAHEGPVPSSRPTERDRRLVGRRGLLSSSLVSLAVVAGLYPLAVYIRNASETSEEGTPGSGKPSGSVWAVVGTSYGMAFSSDGKKFAVGILGGRVELWNSAMKERSTLRLGGDSDRIFSVAFSPDGSLLAGAGTDNTVWLWNFATRTTARRRGHPDTIWSVAFSPDGKTLASASNELILVWDVATGRKILTLKDLSAIKQLAFSPDGRTIATASGEAVVLRDAATGSSTAVLHGHANQVNAVAFSPDGKTLASAGHDKTVRLWDLATRRTTATLTDHSGTVNVLAFSPDGTTLASGSSDKTVRLWDVSSGRSTATVTGHSDAVNGVAFSPDGKTLATPASPVFRT
ncbi:protein kinase [Nonomuraea purpurea]|uniref:Protein kinase n=1 Tax=Nonomuraea purpurea TaxID=1849276 RepID=A0ABV8GKR8_9ACTN